MKKIIILFLIILTCFLSYQYFFSKKATLEKSFSKSEIKQIETLSKSDQDYFLSKKQLYPLLTEKEFKTNNFSKYLTIYKKNSQIPLATIISVGNTEIEITDQVLNLLQEKDFQINNLNRYFAYQKKNPTLNESQIIKLVNQDIDTITMEYDETIEQFLQEKYFIKNNLERYMEYQKKYQTDNKTTVSYVNSNLDHEYYTHTQNTDLTKEFLMIVNKYYVLPKDYVPKDLVTIENKYGKTLQIDKTTYEAFKQMADDAKKESLTLYITSPYRSYQTQASLYKRYSDQDGQKLADTYSARAGYSEHQTGLAADIVSGPNKSLASFENTKEFTWIKENAHNYGFILRYPEGKEKITGYQYEPWHYRYVGKEVASKIKDLGITFDEYYAYYIED